MDSSPQSGTAPRHVHDYLRQIVYGGNDGIVTTFAIVAGFAGATAEGVGQIGAVAVLVFGLANLFADAVSMGLGEFLSGRATAALWRGRQRALLNQIARDPAGQAETLAAHLRAQGLGAQAADRASAAIADNPQALARMILDLEAGPPDPTRQPAPALNGLVTFASFVIFGSLPLMPYLAGLSGSDGLRLSVCASILSLLALGVLRWRVTREPPLRALGETLAVGAVCGAVAFGVGWVVVG